MASLSSEKPDLLNLSASSLSFNHENKAHFHVKRSKYEDAYHWSNAFGPVPQVLFKIKVYSNDTDPKGVAFQSKSQTKLNIRYKSLNFGKQKRQNNTTHSHSITEF